MSSYKIIDLFGNETIKFVENKKTKINLFSDYDAFLDKFETKKTTDDCYTPVNVYNVVIDYVNEKVGIEGRPIIRPFFPDGDFENIDYPENCVVVDNPPFSIITKICKFYIEKGIDFFLFAPHLTNFGSDIDCTHIVVSADITYENGAKVRTSFLSNMFGDKKIIGDAELAQKFKDIQEQSKVNLPKYEYPDNIITVSKISYIVEKGISIEIDKKDLKHYRQMDAQKVHKKALFGSGFLCSQATAQATAQAKNKENVIVWELSDKEKAIINQLG